MSATHQKRQRTAVLAFHLCALLVASAALAQSQIFTDGFESGNLASWSRSREQVPGSLQVNDSAAMGDSDFGLEVVANGYAFVLDDSPNGETVYRASFLFRPDTLRLRTGARVEILRLYSRGGRHHVRLALQQVDPGRFAVHLLVRGNRGSYDFIGSGFVDRGAETEIELLWTAATTRNGFDGSVALSIDGVPAAQEPTVANGRLDVRAVRLGLVAGRVGGATGSMDFDDFASFRTLSP